MLSPNSFEFVPVAREDASSQFINALSGLLDQLKTDFETCENQEPVSLDPMPFALRKRIMDRLL